MTGYVGERRGGTEVGKGEKVELYTDWVLCVRYGELPAKLEVSCAQANVVTRTSELVLLLLIDYWS